MSKLKKFDDYINDMNEQDQHRVESEKDVAVQNQIDDLNSDDVDKSDIDKVQLSASEIDKLRNVNDVHENSNFDLNKPAFTFSVNVGGLSRQRAEHKIAQLMEDYKDPNYNMFFVPIKEGDNKIECIWNPSNMVNEGAVKNLLGEIKEVLNDFSDQIVINCNKGGVEFEDAQEPLLEEYTNKIFELCSKTNESLTETEDIPDIIVDAEKARRFKETKDTLDDKSKEVYDTTTDVEKSLEKGDKEEDAQEPYKESDETEPEVNVNDYVIEEDFVIHPDGEDFKLIKKALGEDTDYQSLREFLKKSFPGWENHTSEILDAWPLIK